jgi:hypothetical protein
MFDGVGKRFYCQVTGGVTTGEPKLGCLEISFDL